MRVRMFSRWVRFVLVVGYVTFGAAPCLSAEKDSHLSGDEKRLWQRAREQERVLNNSGLIYEDSALEHYLTRVVGKLQPAETLDPIPFRVRVIKNPYFNAFAFPNGAIYIHSGILARMENEAQLAALLAHEMTHCTHRHALKRIRNLRDRSTDEATSLKDIHERGAHSRLLNLLGSIGWRAAVNGYSRELETEADMVGVRLVLRAGYDPAEGVKLFGHLKEELEWEKDKEPFFFGSHPKLQARMENYRHFLGRHHRVEGIGVRNRKSFSSHIQKLVLDNAFLDLKAGRFRMAQRGAQKCLVLRPGDPKVYYLLGEILRQRGMKKDREKALAYYERAIALDPSDPDPYKAIGLIYYKKGEKRLAKRSFELCLTLAPFTPDKAYIQGYLKKCGPE